MGLKSTPFIAVVLLLSGCGGAQEVEVVSPRKSSIRESFSEPAKTRLVKEYPIAMPIAGRIGRIDLEPGDPVAEGCTLADIDRVPFENAVREAEAAVRELESQILVKEDNRLEETALAETEAAILAASETLNAADAQVEAEFARMERAQKELERTHALGDKGAVTPQRMDDVRLDAETSRIELRSQEFYRAALKAFITAVHLGPEAVMEYLHKKGLERRVMTHQLEQARVRLAQARHELELAALVSPIAGVVLERYEQGDDTLPAGAPLLLIGDLNDLEAVAEVRTEDALRLAPGSAVELEPASGLPAIGGTVKKIEPAGFTKRSSLGVEQQRVHVIVSFAETPSELGVGFRLQAEFFTGSKEEALLLPRACVLQARDGSFYALLADETDRIVRREIEVGLRSDLDLEILSGLSEGDRVLAHPDTTLEMGAKVRAASGR